MAEKVGVRPETLLLFASFNVMVTVDAATPSATTGLEPEMVEFAATAEPGVNKTVPSDFTTGVTIDRFFVSATKEFKVQVEIPEAFVIEHDP